MGCVLYLDDEETLVLLASRMLEHLGHSIAGFVDANEALAAFKAEPRRFDLVLTDMSMPGTSGLEFAQEILKIEPGTVVVISTGCVDPNWADHALALGVRAVVEKPMTLGEMAKTIDRLLK